MGRDGAGGGRGSADAYVRDYAKPDFCVLTNSADLGQPSVPVKLAVPWALTFTKIVSLDAELQPAQRFRPCCDILFAVVGRCQNPQMCALLNYIQVHPNDIAVGRYQDPSMPITEPEHLLIVDSLLP